MRQLLVSLTQEMISWIGQYQIANDHSAFEITKEFIESDFLKFAENLGGLYCDHVTMLNSTSLIEREILMSNFWSSFEGKASLLIESPNGGDLSRKGTRVVHNPGKVVITTCQDRLEYLQSVLNIIGRIFTKYQQQKWLEIYGFYEYMEKIALGELEGELGKVTERRLTLRFSEDWTNYPKKKVVILFASSQPITEIETDSVYIEFEDENVHQLSFRPVHVTKVPAHQGCWRRYRGSLDMFEGVKRCCELLNVACDLAVVPGAGVGVGSAGSSLSEILRDYIKRHQDFVTHPTLVGSNSKILVMTCNPLFECGGNGDRFNGIVTAFLLSVFTDRLFFLDFDYPYDLQFLFEPRLVDWRLKRYYGIPDKFYNFHDRRKQFLDSSLREIAESQDQIIAVHFNHRLTKGLFEFFKGSDMASQIKGIPFLAAEIHDLLFWQSTKYLNLATSALVQDLFKGLLGTGNEPFLSIHFRAGNGSPENWNDPARHSLETDLGQFLHCADYAVRKHYPESHEKIPWFFSADVSRDRLFQVLRENFPQFVDRVRVPSTDSGLVHIDRTFDAAEQIQGTVHAYANHVVLQKSALMVISRSFYGETAAEIGRVPYVYFYEGCIPVDLSSS
jgi:hypothetical protein